MNSKKTLSVIVPSLLGSIPVIEHLVLMVLNFNTLLSFWTTCFPIQQLTNPVSTWPALSILSWNLILIYYI